VLAINEHKESEMAESVRTGLTAVSADATGVLICLVDHPLVLPETIRAVVALHRDNPEAIVIPSWNQKRGHPTLFPRKIIGEIFLRNSLRGVRDGNAGKICYLEVGDEGILLDMDTTEDYERILKSFNMKG
jgi:molybdenum cofactor cytidylyltransferase